MHPVMSSVVVLRNLEYNWWCRGIMVAPTLLMTVYHVLGAEEEGDKIKAILHVWGRCGDVTLFADNALVAHSYEQDIAILRLPGPVTEDRLVFTDACQELKEGDLCYMLQPAGGGGYFPSKHRQIRGRASSLESAGQMDLVQDAPALRLVSGYCGSPVVDSEGRWVGMVNGRLGRDKGFCVARRFGQLVDFALNLGG